MRIVPPKKPHFDFYELEEHFPEVQFQRKKPFLLGVRGYYILEDWTLSKNQFAVYDDAIFIIAGEQVIPFNANTDPTKNQPGRAMLIPGTYEFELGVHNRTKEKSKQYLALIQSKEVSVSRYGSEGVFRGWFGINIHRGGKITTGSEGCQTIWPDQWLDFIDTVRFEIMDAFQMRFIQYILVEAKRK